MNMAHQKTLFHFHTLRQQRLCHTRYRFSGTQQRDLFFGKTFQIIVQIFRLYRLYTALKKRYCTLFMIHEATPFRALRSSLCFLHKTL